VAIAGVVAVAKMNWHAAAAGFVVPPELVAELEALWRSA
jgi:hypothetical protein